MKLKKFFATRVLALKDAKVVGLGGPLSAAAIEG